MSELTLAERDVLEHALGASGRNPGYRNHYVTDEGTTAYCVCCELEEKGMMRRHVRDWVTGVIFTVTASGQSEIGIRATDR